MANNYHDETGKFCSRDQMRKALQHAGSTGNVTVWMQLKKDLQQADIDSNYLPSKNGLIHPALKSKESDTKERDLLIENGTREELEKWVTNRNNTQEFVELLDERDVMKDRARILNQEHKDLKALYNKGEIADYEIVRQKGFEAQDAYEELQLLKNQANEYKDVTALAVASLSEKLVEEQKENGTYREYTETTLNDLVETGNFASGSREWLEQRQKGIGGSDIGKILGAVDENERKYNRREYNDILGSKIDPITDEQVEVQSDGHISYTGYAGRGNAWEDYIQHKFSQNNPDLNVTHCKTSWKNKNAEHQFANFDGLMTDENGKPNGILEIKTASDASKWKDTSLGIEGVPSNYKYQALWYADAAGFEKGAVAVMIDDREYREYHFTMTPELKAEVANMKAKVDTFNSQVEGVKNGSVEDPRTPKDWSGRQGFSDNFVRNAKKGEESSFTEAAILREETVKQTKRRFKKLVGEDDSKENVIKALRTLYTEKPVETRKRNFVNIDLETTSTSPTAGHIIEAGVSVRTPKGEEVQKINKLYGMPNRARVAQSTGQVNVHQITEGMIAKKRTFGHKEEQAKMLATLKSGIMVAHNAGFEKEWFMQHLDGFAEAYKKGEIQILDTKNLAYRVTTNTPDAKLESFTANYGIPYVNAHRAYFDAQMMGEALTRFINEKAA